MIGDIVEVASSKDSNFNYIPKNYTVPEDVDYFHCTSNNTIFGTQMNHFPKTNVKMVCDMSSDILSRQMDFSQFDLIYAGAQKNMGPAGTIPSMLDYKVHIAKESMFNTPAVFPVYVSMLTLQWLKDLGGIEQIEKINNEKASLLYSEIDRNSLFKGFVSNHEDRSKMNATFSLTDNHFKERFDTLWKEAGINGLNGHRNIGGYRASMYNALPLESVQVLVDVMKETERIA